MISLMKIYGMYFSEGPNFLLVWGQHFASGCQNFANGGQNFASEVSKFC
jgi:cation diffusion facilitator CzcD-associated flavoprotein CzcO